MLSFLMTKQGALVGAIVLALTVSVAWINGRIQAAEARGQAEEMARVARAEFDAVIDSINGHWAERDAAYAAENAALKRSLGQEVHAHALSRESATAVTADARRAIAELSGKVDSLTQIALNQATIAIDSLEEAERLCSGALGTCQDLVKAADARIWDLEARQRQALDLTRNQAVTIERLQNLGRPKMGTGGYVAAAVAAVSVVLNVVQAASGG